VVLNEPQNIQGWVSGLVSSRQIQIAYIKHGISRGDSSSKEHDFLRERSFRSVRVTTGSRLWKMAGQGLSDKNLTGARQGGECSDLRL
jgi:hypothetical protein